MRGPYGVLRSSLKLELKHFPSASHLAPQILEGPMTAVEATAPVAWLHDRDAPARAAGQAQT